MPAAKDCHTLTSYYIKGFKARYGTDPDVNRVKARWDFDSVLQSLSMTQVKELIDYYFTCPPTNRHDLQWFFWNYDKLAKSMREARVDAERTDRLREESKIRAEKWRQSGKQGIANTERSSKEQ